MCRIESPATTPEGAEPIACSGSSGEQKKLAYEAIFLAEQEARRAAERAARRMASLQRVTSALANALTFEAVANVAVDQGVAAAGAFAGSLLVASGGALEVLQAVGYQSALLATNRRIPLTAPGPAADAMISGEPVWVRALAELHARYPQIDRDKLSASTRSLCSVPLLAQTRRLGVLVMSFAEPRAFDEEDREFIVSLARQCAQALERARLHEERDALIERERRVALENARLYREAHEADRRKDEFLAMLSHELRNPLAPIMTGLELLRLRGHGDDRILSTVDRQVKTMVRLVDDLLDVSRVTRGKIELKREPLDVAAVVNAAVEAVRALIAARKQALTIDVPARALTVHGDRVRLEQVVVNLLTNAAKYTEPGGEIALRAEVSGDDARIEVSDTGVGIQADLLPHVFEPFMQARRTLDRSQGGLGIGLTLVKRLVEQHGGRVEARSEGPGRGTTVSIWLPLAPAAPTGLVAQAGELPAPAAAPLRVLIVDDNVDAAEGIKLALQAWGHAATMAHDGEAALDAAGACDPDLILLDIGLPGMDGYEVVRRLRADKAHERACIVAVSGYGQDQDRRRSEEAGFNAHLTKPVALRQILDLVAHAAQRR